jgi:uncharacterized membrane protein YozB (DUF420 family)
MPFRHAHYYLLALLPLTLFAFWPGYFSILGTAPIGFHVHGVTASLWIVLLAFQSWSIHRRRNALHRTIGYASFALFPLFTVGGLLVVQSMAVALAGGNDPFYNVYGARLGIVDTLSTLAILYLFFMALRWRRKVHLHARYMLTTVFFLLMPILTRILTDYPPFEMDGPGDLSFGYAFHVSTVAGVALAVALYLRAPKHGRPMIDIGALLLLQSILFETFGRTPAWLQAYIAIGSIPAAALISAGLAASLGIIWLGWISARVPRRSVQAA